MESPVPLKAVLTPPVAAAQSVVRALQNAAHSTGVDFGFLLKTAMRESALNPQAHARTSSAAGLFQFVEQTWLGMMKAHGAKHGYGALSEAINRGPDGRLIVPDAGARARVMQLRYDPQASAAMAAEMTAGHAAYLKGRLGRDPNAGELYAAHFLGPAGAGDLAQAVRSQPQARADSLFPQAARANGSIFYKEGRPVSVTELMNNLSRHTSGPDPVITTQDANPADTESGFIRSHLNRLKTEQALIDMMMGPQAGAGLLVSAQLMSAFGPEPQSESGASPLG